MHILAVATGLTGTSITVTVNPYATVRHSQLSDHSRIAVSINSYVHIRSAHSAVSVGLVVVARMEQCFKMCKAAGGLHTAEPTRAVHAAVAWPSARPADSGLVPNTAQTTGFSMFSLLPLLKSSLTLSKVFSSVAANGGVTTSVALAV